jgi:hypothetical protein
MANLTPVAGYDPIPQLEKTDRIVGGAGGVSNTQAQALINNIEQVKSDYIPQVEKGVPGGIPYLDENGKVPPPMIPTSGSLRGKWNADTNTPTITQGSNVVGGETMGNSDYFMVDVAGTWEGIDFIVGDRLMWSDDDDAWFKLAGSSVSSVNGLQGAVAVPNTKIILGTTTITPSFDERLIANGSTITLGNAVSQGITIQIVFLANTYITYKNILGNTVSDYVLANRRIEYVWTGSAWFAVSEHAIGETIQEIGMPNENPCRLYGGGWQRVYFGGVYLRDGNTSGAHTYLVKWNNPTQAVILSGTFDYGIYQSAFYQDLYVGIHSTRVSAISSMSASTVNFTSNMWDNANANPGNTYLSFGLKESLPNLFGTYSAREISERVHNVYATGVFYDAGNHPNDKYSADGDDDGAPAMIGFNARRLGNKTWGRTVIDPSNTTSNSGQNAPVRVNCIDVYHWKRIY